MKAINNWRDVLRWAWSVRLIALAAILSGVEIVLPFLIDSFPRLVFAVLSFVATIASFVARFVAQKELTK